MIDPPLFVGPGLAPALSDPHKHVDLTRPGQAPALQNWCGQLSRIRCDRTLGPVDRPRSTVFARFRPKAFVMEDVLSFDEAATVLGDPLAVMIDDHSQEERRLLTTGLSRRQRLIIVAHTDRDGRVRVVSARDVTPAERKQYESGE